MLKKLTVNQVSDEQREFAERTANNIVCNYWCGKNCSGPDDYVEDRIMIDVVPPMQMYSCLPS